MTAHSAGSHRYTSSNGDRSPSDRASDLAGLLGTVVRKVTGKEISLSPEMAQQIASLVTANLPPASEPAPKKAELVPTAAECGEKKKER